MNRHVYFALFSYVLLGMLLMFGQFSPSNLPNPEDRQYIVSLVLAILPGFYLLTTVIKGRFLKEWESRNTPIRSSHEYIGLKFIYLSDEKPDEGVKVILGWVSVNNDVRTQDGYVLNDKWYDTDGTLCTSDPEVWIPMPYAYKD